MKIPIKKYSKVLKLKFFPKVVKKSIAKNIVIIGNNKVEF